MKKAFTLLEMLIVVTIIGILTFASINAIKPSTSNYNKLYKTAYDGLLQASGNAKLDWNPVANKCDSGFIRYGSEDCWGEAINKGHEKTLDGGIAGFPREYPGFLFGDPNISSLNGIGTDENFCKSLTKYINTLDSSNECQSFISNFDTSKTPTNSFYKQFCALSMDSSPSGGYAAKCDPDGEDNKPTFVASNGQKFYISPITFINHTIDGKDNAKRHPYRFVVVDINGDKGPNSQIEVDSNPPDLVLFAIDANANVIPLGRPPEDELYISAVIYYPETLNKIDSLTGEYMKNPKIKSDKMSLLDAKMKAFSGTTSGAAGVSRYYTQFFVDGQPFAETEHLSYMANNCVDDPSACTSCSYSSGGKNYCMDSIPARLVNIFNYKTSIDATFIYPTNETASADVLETEYGCTVAGSKCKITLE